MTARGPKRLPPPSDAERSLARTAAAALRAAIADPSTMGAEATMHADFSRPRRSMWLTTWDNLPGFVRVSGRGGHYTHALLPGWTYARSEIVAELIPDLERLAELGLRPTQATTGAAA